MEDNALYRPTLKRAWQTTNKNRALWFFGLLAALLGTGGEYEIMLRLFSNPNSNASDGLIIGILNSLQAGWQEGLAVGGNFKDNLWTAIVSYPQGLILAALFFLVVLGLSLFFLWLAVISQIGLIRNADLILKNKKTNVNEGIDAATKKFWPIFLANLILKLILLILFVIIDWELVALVALGRVGNVLYYLSLVLFVIVILSASFFIRYQIFYLVLKKQKFLPALQSGWQLFKNNWLVSLEMALILFGCYVVALIATSIVALFFGAILFVLFIYFSLAFWLAGLVSLISLLLSLVVTFWITAWVNTFSWVAWTILFNRLNGEEATSKIIRQSQKIPAFFQR